MHKNQASNLFRALGDESRVKIMKELYDNETFCVSELLKKVDCSQSTLSYHLANLYEVNLVSFKKKGKRIYYYCNRPLVNELMKFLTA